MPGRETTAVGTPCWADLWTSDVEGSRRFYGELFGWEPQEPSPEFDGYFMFNRRGRPSQGAWAPCPTRAGRQHLEVLPDHEGH